MKLLDLLLLADALYRAPESPTYNLDLVPIVLVGFCLGRARRGAKILKSGLEKGIIWAATVWELADGAMVRIQQGNRNFIATVQHSRVLVDNLDGARLATVSFVSRLAMSRLTSELISGKGSVS